MIARTVAGGDVWRCVDRDARGEIVSVEIVSASRGVDLRGLPHEIEELGRAGGHGLPVPV